MNLGELVQQIKQRCRQDLSRDEIRQQINILLQKCPTWCSLIVSEGVQQTSQRVMSAEPHHLSGGRRAVFKLSSKVPFKLVRESLDRVQQKHIAHVRDMLAHMQRMDTP